MELTILGSGTAIPSMQRGSPSLAIKAGSRRGGEFLIFDLGPGSLRRMAEAGIDLFRVNHLFLTHFHVDHTSDLPALLFAKRYLGIKVNEDLTIHGPKGTVELIEGIQKVWGDQVTSGDKYNLFVDEIDESCEEIEGDGWVVLPKHVKHHNVALGYRVEDDKGRAIVFTGDTDYCPEVVELAKGAQILVSECSCPDNMKVDGHLTPTLAARVAREACVERLILTHLYPPMDKIDVVGEVERTFKGQVFLGADLMRVGLS